MSLFSKKPVEEPQNIDEVLAQFKELQQRFEALSQEMKDLKKENRRNISKVAMVRFNPFNEIGSNQSFSLAMLDDNDRGAVVTSLFSREGNRVYGKPVSEGNSEFKLTEEEKKVIEIAQNRNS
ncbi:MAG: DUF4446 family protein [Candidatus Pacebacteria bacterium]|jgi:hypothetical protein|nr:DUF4446 family protein [Candidatus Paceibacterota bacterium]